jgi:hypothetical protein
VKTVELFCLSHPKNFTKNFETIPLKRLLKLLIWAHRKAELERGSGKATDQQKLILEHLENWLQSHY